MTLEELIGRCKGAFYLTVNDHKNIYNTVEEYLMTHVDCDVDEKERAAMIETDTIYNLHFYPDTPIGFYQIYAATLHAALREAFECFKERVPK